MYSILIVDDEDIIVNGIQEVMKESNMDWTAVHTASSAAQALERFEKMPYDIVVSDIRMPEMDGLDMAAEIRKLWPDTHFIFLTGYQDFEYARAALRLHSDDYLLKPVRDETLLSAVRTVVENMDQVWLERIQKEYHSAVRENREIGEDSNSQGYCLAVMCSQMEDYPGMTVSIQGLMENMFGYFIQITECRCEELVILVFFRSKLDGELTRTVCQKGLEEMQSFYLEHNNLQMKIGWMQVGLKGELKEYLQYLKNQLLTEEYGRLLYYEQLQEKEKEAENYVIEAVFKHIQCNPQEDLSLSALSAKFHINPSYLSRTFHQCTGQALSEYITEIRLELAKKLLIQTDEKIYEIAQKVGFETAGYFAKVFAKLVGESPKVYRMNRQLGILATSKELYEK